MEEHELHYKPTDYSTKPLPMVLDQEVSEYMSVFTKPYKAPRQLRGRRKLVKMEASEWYKNDNLGLKTLKEADRV